MVEWVVLSYADAHHDGRTAFSGPSQGNTMVWIFQVAINSLQWPEREHNYGT